MSFRDIGAIRNKKEKEKNERKDKHDKGEYLHKPTNYSRKVKPEEVAIALNIREPEVVKVLCRILEAKATL